MSELIDAGNPEEESVVVPDGSAEEPETTEEKILEPADEPGAEELARREEQSWKDKFYHAERKRELAEHEVRIRSEVATQPKATSAEDAIKELDREMLENPALRNWLGAKQNAVANDLMDREDLALEWAIKRDEYRDRKELKRQFSTEISQFKSNAVKSTLSSNISGNSDGDTQLEVEIQKVLMEDWGVDVNAPANLSNSTGDQIKRAVHYATLEARRRLGKAKGHKPAPPVPKTDLESGSGGSSEPPPAPKHKGETFEQLQKRLAREHGLT